MSTRCFFFFQAEDGIRDGRVTGVQTCALPIYAAASAGSFAYRTTNWVEGESLADALRRGPRPIPTAHTLVRDLLSAAEHAHARGVILRRIVPLTLMLELSGRAVITDLRYANWCLPNVPPEERGAGGAFVAPEVRAGGPGGRRRRSEEH